jgi:hypothetical protein
MKKTILFLLISFLFCSCSKEQNFFMSHNHPVGCSSVGDSYQSGYVAYIFQVGDAGYVVGQCHGFVISTSDLSTGIIWHSSTTDGLINTTSLTFGTGASNTAAIITAYGAESNAAKLCNSQTTGGYTWYLPSRDEWIKIQPNKTAIGLGSNIYWTSSESTNQTYSWDIWMSDGTNQPHPKTDTYYIRAIHNF